MKELIQVDEARRPGLRSHRTNNLKIPRTKRQTFAAHSFSAMAPHWWNNLPTDLKAAETLDLFKKRLKTFLYCQF